MRDIEGQATRVEASECGQRTSFNQPREAGDSVWETEHVRRMTLMHRTDRGRHLLNARLVSLRIRKRFTIGYESAFGIRQSASLLQGAFG